MSALRWSARLPFYGMPAVLTLLAWDLYGGFGVHLRWAVGLALAGALFGAWTERRGESSVSEALGWAVVAQPMAILAGALGETWARWTLGHTPPPDDGGAATLAHVGLTLTVVAAGTGSHRMRRVGVGAWLGLVVAARLAYVGDAAAAILGGGLVVLGASALLRTSAEAPGRIRRAVTVVPTLALLLLMAQASLLLSALTVDTLRGRLGGSGLGLSGPEDLPIVAAMSVVGAFLAGVRATTVAAAWSALGAGLLAWGTATVVSAGPGGLWALAVAPALLAWTPWGARLAPLGWAVAGLIFGPVVGRYAVAALPGLGSPDDAWIAAGPVAALALGIGLLGKRLPEAPLPTLAGRLVLLCLAGALLIHLAVFFALMPIGFVVTGVLLGGSAWASRFTPTPTLHPVPALWLFFYVAFGSTVAFKEGPDADECAEVLNRTEATVLLDRHGDAALEGAPYAEADPYDLLPDADAEHLVVTFKRFDRRGGWLEVLRLDDPTRRTRLTTQRPDGLGPLWPERFVRDPRTDRYYFGMLGIGAYALWEGAVVDGEMTILRTAPLAWEPSYPAIDVDRGLLIQSYLAAGIERGSNKAYEQPLIEIIDLEKLSSEGRWSLGPGRTEMSEFAAVNPASGRWFIPAFFSGIRFALVEFGEGPEPTRAVETFHPTIAVVPDPATDRLFVTNSLGGTVDTYGLDDLKRRHAEPTGRFPRDMVLDGRTGRVYVGNYSSGTVTTLRTRAADGTPVSPRVVADVEVGPVLRGIAIHEASGRVFAASACGVFEVPTDG